MDVAPPPPPPPPPSAFEWSASLLQQHPVSQDSICDQEPSAERPPGPCQCPRSAKTQTKPLTAHSMPVTVELSMNSDPWGHMG